MSDSGRPPATKTVANATLEELITPKLPPGKACLIVIRGRSVGQVLELDRRVVLGRAPEVDLSIDDVAVSRQHAQVEKGADGFAVLDLNSTNGLFVNGVRVTRQPLRDGDRIQVGTTTILKFCFQDELETSFQKKLYDSATRDSLTGLYNRRFLLDTLEVDFSYSYRNATALSLLLLDLDHFKPINDSLGHLAGDGVLKETASIIQRGLRAEDVGARYGGEEFAVLLRYTDAAHAFAIAERIRREIEAHRFAYEGHEIRVTTSIGLSTLEARCHQGWQQMIEEADAHLYKAKQQGRNKTSYAALDSTARLTQRTLSLTPEELQAAQAAEAREPPSPPRRPLRKGSKRKPPRRS